jgi:hypothetical protein
MYQQCIDPTQVDGAPGQEATLTEVPQFSRDRAFVAARHQRRFTCRYQVRRVVVPFLIRNQSVPQHARRLATDSRCSTVDRQRT